MLSSLHFIKFNKMQQMAELDHFNGEWIHSSESHIHVWMKYESYSWHLPNGFSSDISGLKCQTFQLQCDIPNPSWLQTHEPKWTEMSAKDEAITKVDIQVHIKERFCDTGCRVMTNNYLCSSKLKHKNLNENTLYCSRLKTCQYQSWSL